MAKKKASKTIQRKYGDAAFALAGKIADKESEGKELTRSQELFQLISDGKWHDGTELAMAISWRFGGFLHTLKDMGIDWEKRLAPGVDRKKNAYQYRLVNLAKK